VVTNRDAPVPKASVGEVFVMTFIMAAVSGLGAVRSQSLNPNLTLTLSLTLT